MPLQTGVIDGLTFPPLGLLNPVLDTGGPYWAGSWTFDTFHTDGAYLLPAGEHPVHGTYGVIAAPNGAIPITWGYSIGLDSGGALGLEGYRYDNRFCQLVPMHQVLGGQHLPLEIIDCHYLSTLVTWPYRLIGGARLGLHVSPGIQIDLFYLCVL